tara:strand:+ start:150 stop:782 length:633 start_codon:yes stop_codon:yes gene_type:complete
MNNLLLQSLPLTGVSGNPTGNLLGGFMGAFIGIFVVVILVFLALYLYLSIAYSKIGSKAGLNSPGIAWMPYGGWLAVIFESSKMHWWPFLMLVLGLAGGYLLMLSSFAIGSAMMILSSIILFATMIVFGIMNIVWHWKTYEAVGKPGWWILVSVIAGLLGYALIFLGGYAEISAISVIGIILGIIGVIAHFVLIGIAAWSESQDKVQRNI